MAGVRKKFNPNKAQQSVKYIPDDFIHVILLLRRIQNDLQRPTLAICDDLVVLHECTFTYRLLTQQGGVSAQIRGILDRIIRRQISPRIEIKNGIPVADKSRPIKIHWAQRDLLNQFIDLYLAEVKQQNSPRKWSKISYEALIEHRMFLTITNAAISKYIDYKYHNETIQIFRNYANSYGWKL
jgi:hypothetical protein